jgi:hypothetical protein
MDRAFKSSPASTKEQNKQSGFFEKSQSAPFFGGNTLQRLASPEDKKEASTNDGRMKQDKDIQRCPCDDKKEK